MLKKFVTILGGDPNKRTIERYSTLVEQINALEGTYEALSDEALRLKTGEFRDRLKQNETLDDLLPEAFAAVREASKRTIGLRHYDVQMIGGIALHQGKIAEMRTGEGKTLVATLPLYVNALTGQGVHLITVNDYLARRDARWMGPVYAALGMSVGVLQMAARTENGKKGFLVDLDRVSPHEDQHQLRMVPRQEAYAADITYGTNSEFGFDYLRDNMNIRMDERVQRGHSYAIVDEVDNVLIDEARTPLIISGPAGEDTEWYVRMAQVVRQLRAEDYEINERDRTITLTEIGETHVEELIGIPLRDPERPEDVTPEQARLVGYLEQALRAQFLFRRNKDYLIQAGKVVIVDEFTGRLMPGRRWSDGLHQAVEAKEGVRVQAENVTYATITIQNYFRMYAKLAGMSGTALTEAEEFNKIYKLDVLAIPTNLEYNASQANSSLQLVDGRDEQNYKVRYYTRSNDPGKTPIFWQRKDYPDVIYRTEETKFRAITLEILRNHVQGRPLLVGTTSVELSDRLSNRLRADPLRRLAQIQLIRHTWLEQNHRTEDGRLIEELQHLNDTLDQIQLADLRKMARDLGIPFNPEEPANITRILSILNLTDKDQKRLVGSLEGGIPHQVLNARKHTEESQIIAGAGAFGAVMIATNMAGRGVDIKLGGGLPEDVVDAVNRVLRRAGQRDPYDLSMEERYQALTSLSQDQYGIYEAQINRYIQYVQDMAQVKSLGGLHVIGSERHEARRIDNQLRGRSARQGDPGSSRFYLSLEDELMRRFGGDQADSLMKRLKIDDAVPMEVGLVSRLVEQSQTRVEGANFDIRKHLLEYDDVLNSQRSRIYSQRDRIFTKEDLHDDVVEMLRAEVQRRVPEALEAADGPWKLLAWLEQIQPSLTFSNTIYPSYTLRLLLQHIIEKHPQFKDLAEVRQALLELAGESLTAEEEHLHHEFLTILDSNRTRIENQLNERLEVLDTFVEGLGLEDKDDTTSRNPREMLDELSSLVHVPLRLSPEEGRMLRSDPEQVLPALRSQIEAALVNQSSVRLLGALERRITDELELNPAQLSSLTWDAKEELLTKTIETILNRRRERLLGEGGQIDKDLQSSLEKVTHAFTTEHLKVLLLQIPQGARATFDKKTHRRVVLRTTRLTYIYYAAKLLEKRSSEAITEDVLEHLEGAQDAIRRAWGLNEYNRISNLRLIDLDDKSREALCRVLGPEKCNRLENSFLQSLDKEDILPVVDELGRRSLTEVYRQLLLGVITELWVEYLTQMEALRVSIGLEAYAQRDPLVEYKSQASALFQELFNNMRLSIVTRMFTFRPRELGTSQPGAKRASTVRETESPSETIPAKAAMASEADMIPQEENAVLEPATTHPSQEANNEGLSKSRKRRRHRH